jgi:hypothetical protein
MKTVAYTHNSEPRNGLKTPNSFNRRKEKWAHKYKICIYIRLKIYHSNDISFTATPWVSLTNGRSVFSQLHGGTTFLRSSGPLSWSINFSIFMEPIVCIHPYTIFLLRYMLEITVFWVVTMYRLVERSPTKSHIQKVAFTVRAVRT